LACITVLSQDMGNKNFTNGNWVVPTHGESPTLASRPFERLRGMRLPPSAGGGGKVVTLKPATAVIPAHLPAFRPCRRPHCEQPAVDGKASCQRHLDEDAAAKKRTVVGHKYPPGARSTAAREQRLEFIRQICRQRPFIDYKGEDGLEPMLMKTFGIGVDPGAFNQIRAEIQTELQSVTGRAPAPPKVGGNGAISRMTIPESTVEMVVTPPVPVVLPPVTPSVVAPAGDLMAMGMQFAEAIQNERAAKLALERAHDALSRAQHALEKATTERIALFTKMGGA
jgi:hypothetical protein